MELIGALSIAICTGLSVLAFRYPESHARLSGRPEIVVFVLVVAVNSFGIGVFFAIHVHGARSVLPWTLAFSYAAMAVLFYNLFLRWLRKERGKGSGD